MNDPNVYVSNNGQKVLHYSNKTRTRSEPRRGKTRRMPNGSLVIRNTVEPPIPVKPKNNPMNVYNIYGKKLTAKNAQKYLVARALNKTAAVKPLMRRPLNPMRARTHKPNSKLNRELNALIENNMGALLQSVLKNYE